jgi:hypothetical protein
MPQATAFGTGPLEIFKIQRKTDVLFNIKSEPTEQERESDLISKDLSYSPR